jgi:hypothetical protein
MSVFRGYRMVGCLGYDGDCCCGGYTHIIQIDVDAAILQNCEIADYINSLNVELVTVVCGQKPVELILNERAG